MNRHTTESFGQVSRIIRPYIPLDVRLLVVRRQLIAFCDKINFVGLCELAPVQKRKRLRFLLGALFGPGQVHLDHDPALENREFNPRNGKYKPDANDPEFLLYRTKPDHKIKTFVRGDGALRSDVAQRRYLNRVAANRKPKKKFKPRRAKHIRRLTHASIPVRHD